MSDMCYTARVDTTIRNLDETAYRRLKARAALGGKTMGEVVNEAIHAYLAQPEVGPKRLSLLDLPQEDYAEGAERLSEQVDAIVYGG
jgi:plasmid stability protein